MVMYKKLNGVTVEVSAEEEKEILADREKSRLERPANQLREIRMLRNQKLEETDMYALQDVELSEDMKNYRKNLRNVPQDYSEEQYDELLATDEQGNLTHTVWSKP
jgi:hypothetical protein|tara:strand:+ start:568 stop:885 length:318 start_codon:yes stop_codon:yes gene_type:complete